MTANAKPKAKKKKADDSQELNTLKQVQESLSGCSLTFHWWGILKMVGKEDNETAAKALNAKGGAIRTQRKLIDTNLEEWKNLQRIRTAGKQRYDWHTFPYVVDGQRLFRKEMRDELWKSAENLAIQLDQATLALTAKRDTVIEWAKNELGDVFDESLYPKDWTKSFSCVIREHSIEPPSYLRHTNAEEYQQTLRRSIEDIGQSMRRFESQCMTQVGGAIGRLVNTLTNDGGIRSATVENMQTTFKRITAMKFEGTAMFRSAMSEAEAIVDGVTIFDLRNSHGAREETRKKLEGLMSRYQELQSNAIAKASTTTTEVSQ